MPQMPLPSSPEEAHSPGDMTSKQTMRTARGRDAGLDNESVNHNTSRTSGFQSARPITARMKFHFFSFQIHGTTGYTGHT